MSALDGLDDDVIEICQLATNQGGIPITQSGIQEIEKQSSEISDDEVEIICVKKKERHVLPPIKVESENEEVEMEDDKGGSEKSVELTEKNEDGSFNKKHDSQSQAATRCNSPKDVTCSICLGEFDNKSFLDQCFHILLLFKS